MCNYRDSLCLALSLAKYSFSNGFKMVPESELGMLNPLFGSLTADIMEGPPQFSCPQEFSFFLVNFLVAIFML